MITRKTQRSSTMRTCGLSPSQSLADLKRVLREQPGYEELAACLQRGGQGAVEGAWGSCRALMIAALAELVRGPCLVVVARPADLIAWQRDLESFTGAKPLLFPDVEKLGSQPDGVEVGSQRLRVLRRLDRARMVLTSVGALLAPVPAPEAVYRWALRIQVGHELALTTLIGWLLEHGYTRRDLVELPGEFARRGGIVDVYPVDADLPVRLEFFGDRIDSLRTFMPETQRSVETLAGVEVLAMHASSDGTPTEPQGATGEVMLLDWLPESACVFLVEPEEIEQVARDVLTRVPDPRGYFTPEAFRSQLARRRTVYVSAVPLAHRLPITWHIRATSIERFSGDVRRVKQELEQTASHDCVYIACHNEGEIRRLTEIVCDTPLWQAGQLHLLTGYVHAGFRLPDAGLLVLSDHELFRRDPAWHAERVVARKAYRRYEARAIDSFLDLKENDLVVHVAHGIARYRGLKLLESKGQAEEYLCLEFADSTLLYVPVSRIDLVQKYVGSWQRAPALSRLGSGTWEKKKAQVQQALLDWAAELLELQAIREAQPGIAFPPDSDWQREFEAAFPYDETPDQLAAWAAIKADMEKPRPMDRLLCGDVGFGKTELAMRAAFKAMAAGKQVAVLVPTTVLAEQHYRTFTGRLAEYPFLVACLSRFRSPGEQREIVRRLAAGQIDCIIGTHRLLSDDVRFADLGLVIIDEEQRFGVEHKEKLKKLRHTVDVLTMTATPIPRTLHMALVGLRDISNLETPPRDRLAIETRIVRRDPRLIREGIVRELLRDGQVYFVHNRVHTIHTVARDLRTWVPEARVLVAHGQMPEDDLERAMLDFFDGRADVLVATTIIENGLDLPRVNTIFIDQADQFGLADLHQLRGRVGRSRLRAYCYLLLDTDRPTTPQGLQRIKAIEEYSHLGAGFHIAMRDLEIRGAGNILGTEQSGHIAAVGYELYCQLLESAVRRLKNLPSPPRLDVAIHLPWRAWIPHEYIPDSRQKMEIYRRLNRLVDLDELADLTAELTDRFGAPPASVTWLLRLHELRLLAQAWSLETIYLEHRYLVLRYRNRKLAKELAQRSAGRLKLVDQTTLSARLTTEDRTPDRLYGLVKSLLQSPHPQV